MKVKSGQVKEDDKEEFREKRHREGTSSKLGVFEATYKMQNKTGVSVMHARNETKDYRHIKS